MTDYTYVLRTCNADMTSYGGFKWPKRGNVSAPDWKPTKACGNGLHGAAKGEGDGDLFNWRGDAVWQVVKVPTNTIIDLGGKVKFPSGYVVFSGNRSAATQVIKRYHPEAAAIIGGTSTSGYYGTSTSGYYGTSTSGDRGTSTSGDRGTSTSGNNGTSTSGNNGTSTSGYGGTSTSGYGGTSTSGYGGTSTSGDRGTSTSGDGGTSTSGYKGVLQISYYDNVALRRHIVTGYIGENGLKPNTPYKLNDDHEFVEVTSR